MKCLDPKAWEDDNAYGRDSLESLANHFAVPLSLTKFDRKVAMKRMVNEYGNMFYCTKLEIFLNLFLLVQMIFSYSGSNSATENGKDSKLT